MKLSVKSRIIDVDTIQTIVADLSSNEEDVAQEKYQIVDAFSTPKLQFDDKNKSFKMYEWFLMILFFLTSPIIGFSLLHISCLEM